MIKIVNKTQALRILKGKELYPHNCCLSDNLLYDKQFLLQLMENTHISLSCLDDDFKDDKDIVLKSRKFNTYDFKEISQRLRADKEVVLETAKYSSIDFLEHVAPKLLNDFDFLLQVVKTQKKHHYVYLIDFPQDFVLKNRHELAKIHLSDVMNYSKSIASLLRKELYEKLRDKTDAEKTLQEDPFALEFYSPEIQSDEKLVCIALKQNCNTLKYTPFYNDKEFVLKNIPYDAYPNGLEKSPLRYDLDIQLKYGLLIKSYNENYRISEDKEVVNLLQKHPSFLMQTIKNYNPFIMDYASNKTKKDLDFAKELFKDGKHLYAFPYFAQKIRNNKELVLSILPKNTDNQVNILTDIGDTLKNSKEFFLEALKLNGLYLQDTAKNLQEDRSLVLIAVQNNGLALEFASENLQNTPDIIDVAIENDQRSVFFITDKKLKEEYLEKIDTINKLEDIDVTLREKVNALLPLNEDEISSILHNDSEVLLQKLSQNPHISENIKIDINLKLDNDEFFLDKSNQNIELLSIALRKNNDKLIEILLENYFDPYYEDSMGLSILQISIMCFVKIEYIEYCYKNSTLENKSNIVDFALKCRNTEAILFLLEDKAPATTSSLVLALELNNEAVLQLLLKQLDIDWNYKNISGKNLLEIAYENDSYVEHLKLFLSHNLLSKDLLIKIIQNNNIQLFTFITEDTNYFKDFIQDNPLLLDYAFKSDASDVSLALSKYFSLQSHHLYFAIKHNNKSLVNKCLEDNVSLEYIDEKGYNLLEMSIMSENIIATKYLLEKGLIVKDILILKDLLHSSHFDSLAILNALIENDTQLIKLEIEGENILSYSLQAKSSFAETLLDKGLKPTFEDFVEILKIGNDELIERYKELYINKEYKDENGNNLLEILYTANRNSKHIKFYQDKKFTSRFKQEEDRLKTKPQIHIEQNIIQTNGEDEQDIMITKVAKFSLVFGIIGLLVFFNSNIALTIVSVVLIAFALVWFWATS